MLIYLYGRLGMLAWETLGLDQPHFQINDTTITLNNSNDPIHWNPPAQRLEIP